MPSDLLRIQNQGSDPFNPERSVAARLNILIVEDDDLNQRMINIMLRNTNHIIKFASNGIDAIQSVTSEDFDLVFMDIQMPQMDGLETTRRIREWEKGEKHLLIIGMTAIIDSAYGRCLQAGMDDIIPKPIDIKKFQGMITACANRKMNKTDTHAGDQPEDFPVFDVAGGIKRFGGDRENYEILLKEFVSSFSERFKELLTAWESNNWQRLSSHAHRLKGLSSNFGFMELSRKTFELEQYVNEGQFDRASQKLDEMDISLNNLRSEVQAYLEKTTND